MTSEETTGTREDRAVAPPARLGEDREAAAPAGTHEGRGATPPTGTREGAAPPAALREERERKARGAWRFYQVMAFVTGVMLLLLVVEMILVYLVGVGPDVEAWIAWIPFAHGWIYVVYLVSVFNLWSTMRWGLGRMAALIVAGVIPVLSFVMEHRAKGWFAADLPGVVARPVTTLAR